jgi:hypothetical protein
MGQTTDQSTHPEVTRTEHDLDPNTDGDLVVTVNVSVAEALVLAANSVDENTWSASVEWLNSRAADNPTTTESASDIGLSAVGDDWARLVRKGMAAEVTFTSDETAGTQNRINAFVDAHR